VKGEGGVVPPCFSCHFITPNVIQLLARQMLVL
jgi:hypothetical protein